MDLNYVIIKLVKLCCDIHSFYCKVIILEFSLSLLVWDMQPVICCGKIEMTCKIKINKYSGFYVIGLKLHWILRTIAGSFPSSLKFRIFPVSLLFLFLHIALKFLSFSLLFPLIIFHLVIPPPSQLYLNIVCGVWAVYT